jgi:perosamine synthetase
MAEIAHLIPGPEPPLEVRIPRIPVVEEPATRRIIPVSDCRLDGNELRYVTQCVQSNWISSAGRFVREFEEAFAAAMGCRYGIACSNGTTSLHLALAALGVGPGDEVIIPTFTMIATANAVRYTGATPVLIDAERETWNLDVTQLAARITPRTRGILLVHTYGHPVDMSPLLDVAERRGLWVVEDAAEAHGARYKDRPVGSLGRAASFSFYANKIITTGEGGMVVTNNPDLARRAAFLRDHAMDPARRYYHPEIGFNYRMTNVQAAIGCAQMEQVDAILDRRKTLAAAYEAGLAGVPGLTRPPVAPWAENVYWMYSVLVEPAFGRDRDAVREGLRARGVDSRPFFVPLHAQPPYRTDAPFPVATDLSRRGINLPSGNALTLEQIGTVCAALRELAGR